MTFVQSRSRLTWREVEFGLQNGWLSDSDTVEFAIRRDENRETVEDPFAVVEELYADFDYPEEIAGFVRYMPPEDPL